MRFFRAEYGIQNAHRAGGTQAKGLDYVCTVADFIRNRYRRR